MSKGDDFAKAYQKLNPEQREAVDTIDGPVMVAAGPGTGKTQVLTLRIANILKQTDTEPEEILALTFTEAAARNMRRRLADLVGSEAYQATISTFHGFAEGVIGQYPEEFPRIIGSRAASEAERLSLLENIIDNEELELLKPFGDPFHYVREVVQAVARLKREGITPEELEERLDLAQKRLDSVSDLYHEKGAHKGKMKGKYKDRQKQINKNRELLTIYRRYQDRMFEQQLYDFEDMLMELLRALRENSDLLLNLQERYLYILADEHQDANNAQNHILELLSSHFAPNPNLFVVGDEKQAIFRFQGASSENFNYFRSLYPGVKVIELYRNYRSGQDILDTAEGLLPSENGLQAAGEITGRRPEVYAFSNPEVELFYLARDIAGLLNEGVSPGEVAVLYRENSESELIADALRRLEVPVRIESDRELLEEPAIRRLLIIARAIYEYGEDNRLAEYLHLDLHPVEPLDIFKLLQQAHQNKLSLFDLLADPDRLYQQDFGDPAAVKSAYDRLAQWVKRAANTNLERLFEEILRESGLLNRMLQAADTRDQLNTLDNFFGQLRTVTAADPQAGLGELFRYLELISKHRLSVKKTASPDRTGAVRLMTVHRAKGLEFQYVYLTGVSDGRWGGRRRPEKLPLLPEIFELTEEVTLSDGDRLADERRLFYVALTRAKLQARISYSLSNREGREQLPSRFLEEIDPLLLNEIATEDRETEYQQNRGERWNSFRDSFSLVSDRKKRLKKDQELTTELFYDQDISVTALNNFLECPWKYFYRNLLRLPEPQQPHMMFGSAAHEALEQLFRRLSNEQSYSREDFLEYFISRLYAYPLPEQEIKRYGERGRQSLGGWYDTYSANWQTKVLTEFSIRGLKLNEDITLSGKVDKMELESEDRVVVVDYKTGQPKTRNQILGKTKDGDASLWRQLVFYRLLLDGYKNGRYRLQAAELDFVEPDKQNGKYRKERFEVADSDVEELKQTIEQMAESVLELEFWDQKCSDEKCPYCRLREMLE